MLEENKCGHAVINWREKNGLAANKKDTRGRKSKK